MSDKLYGAAAQPASAFCWKKKAGQTNGSWWDTTALLGSENFAAAVAEVA